MTSIAIATLFTCSIAVLAVWDASSQQYGTTSMQKVLFFGGVFGVVWSIATLAIA